MPTRSPRNLHSPFWGSGMVQWWEHTHPTNVAQVWFPDSASYVGWICCWFSSLLQEVFSGFPVSSKTNTNVAQVWFLYSASYVGWVCWFSSLLWVYSGYSGFFPLLKNQHFQIPIWLLWALAFIASQESLPASHNQGEIKWFIFYMYTSAKKYWTYMYIVLVFSSWFSF